MTDEKKIEFTGTAKSVTMQFSNVMIHQTTKRELTEAEMRPLCCATLEEIFNEVKYRAKHQTFEPMEAKTLEMLGPNRCHGITLTLMERPTDAARAEAGDVQLLVAIRKGDPWKAEDG